MKRPVRSASEWVLRFVIHLLTLRAGLGVNVALSSCFDCAISDPGERVEVVKINMDRCTKQIDNPE
jgi:hypothetical protein